MPAYITRPLAPRSLPSGPEKITAFRSGKSPGQKTKPMTLLFGYFWNQKTKPMTRFFLPSQRPPPLLLRFFPFYIHVFIFTFFWVVRTQVARFYIQANLILLYSILSAWL
jgi:hypothetical protein